MKRLAQKTALVTGGASGLGKGMAKRLAEEGARVIITDVQRELGYETAKEGGFIYLEQDVRDESRWAQVIAEIERQCGPLHVLVNNAGIVGGPSISVSPENGTLENWKAVFAINVEGVFLGCRAAISAMKRAGGGSIINISSIAGLIATPYNAAYGASKAAVWQLTKSVAQHCAHEKLNIRCNSVHPGDVHTPMLDKFAQETAKERGISPQEIVDRASRLSPFGGFTHIEDVAAAVAYLASEESRRITGSQLTIDGGLSGCDTFHWVASYTQYGQSLSTRSS
jgi:3(or 17)beta-hydroxysteroid dehydrogenase